MITIDTILSQESQDKQDKQDKTRKNDTAGLCQKLSVCVVLSFTCCTSGLGADVDTQEIDPIPFLRPLSLSFHLSASCPLVSKLSHHRLNACALKALTRTEKSFLSIVVTEGPGVCLWGGGGGRIGGFTFSATPRTFCGFSSVFSSTPVSLS